MSTLGRMRVMRPIPTPPASPGPLSRRRGRVLAARMICFFAILDISSRDYNRQEIQDRRDGLGWIQSSRDPHSIC